MRSVRWARWVFPLLAGLALIGSSVACGAGQFRLRSAAAEPLLDQELLVQQVSAAEEPTATPSPEPIPTLAPTVTPAPAAAPVKVAVVQVKALRVRGGPGTNHPIVAGVKQGQQLTVLNASDDGAWLKVKAGESEGWVAAEFVKVSEVAPTPAPGQQSAAPELKPVANAPAGALGAARKDVQAFYEELGFTFTEGKSTDGQEQLKGSNHTQQATVTLVGPESALASATMTAVTRYDQETMVLSAAYLLGFVNRVLPGWTEGPAWVQDHLRDAKNGISSTAAAGGVEVRLTGSGEAVTLALAGH